MVIIFIIGTLLLFIKYKKISNQNKMLSELDIIPYVFYYLVFSIILLILTIVWLCSPRSLSIFQVILFFNLQICGFFFQLVSCICIFTLAICTAAPVEIFFVLIFSNGPAHFFYLVWVFFCWVVFYAVQLDPAISPH